MFIEFDLCGNFFNFSNFFKFLRRCKNELVFPRINNLLKFNKPSTYNVPLLEFNKTHYQKIYNFDYIQIYFFFNWAKTPEYISININCCNENAH